MIQWYMELASKISVIGLITVAALATVAGDYAAKSWSIHGSRIALFFAFFGYTVSGLFYIPTLLREGLIITSVLWMLISTIGFLTIGWLVFKETLSPIQVGAVVLGVIAIVILAVFE